MQSISDLPKVQSAHRNCNIFSKVNICGKNCTNCVIKLQMCKIHNFQLFEFVSKVWVFENSIAHTRVMGKNDGWNVLN